METWDGSDGMEAGTGTGAGTSVMVGAAGGGLLEVVLPLVVELVLTEELPLAAGVLGGVAGDSVACGLSLEAAFDALGEREQSQKRGSKIKKAIQDMGLQPLRALLGGHFDIIISL